MAFILLCITHPCYLLKPKLEDLNRSPHVHVTVVEDGGDGDLRVLERSHQLLNDLLLIPLAFNAVIGDLSEELAATKNPSMHDALPEQSLWFNVQIHIVL